MTDYKKKAEEYFCEHCENSCLYDETRMDAVKLKHRIDTANIYFTSLRNMIPAGDL